MTDYIRVVKPDQDANVKCSIQVPENVEDPGFVVSILSISYVGLQYLCLLNLQFYCRFEYQFFDLHKRVLSFVHQLCCNHRH